MQRPHFPDADFLGSFPELAKLPELDGPVIAFAGRSNSGKSSLLSALCNRNNLARISSTPGKTRDLNAFKVSGAEYNERNLFLVDLPGFGYAKISHGERIRLRRIVDEFLAGCENLALIVIVLDARRKTGEEEENIVAYCRKVGMPFIMARTKWDKLNTKERNRAKADWKQAKLKPESQAISSTRKTGLLEMMQRFAELDL